jgi:hypothetical protein
MPNRDTTACFAGSNVEEFQANIVHPDREIKPCTPTRGYFQDMQARDAPQRGATPGLGA